MLSLFNYSNYKRKTKIIIWTSVITVASTSLVTLWHKSDWGEVYRTKAAFIRFSVDLKDTTFVSAALNSDSPEDKDMWASVTAKENGEMVSYVCNHGFIPYIMRTASCKIVLNHAGKLGTNPTKGKVN